MAIQDRRGSHENFDPQKLLPGEWATVLSGDPNASDGRAVYKCFEPGHVKRMATYEDMTDNITAATEDVAAGVADQLATNLNAAVQRADTASQAAETAAENANSKAAAANTAASNANSKASLAETAATSANTAASNANAAATAVSGIVTEVQNQVTALDGRMETAEANISNMWKTIYPVGAIYISTVATSPTSLFGGTWEAYGQGRVMVGAGTSDRTYAPGEIGGQSPPSMPSHKHFDSGSAAIPTGYTSKKEAAYGTQGALISNSEYQKERGVGDENKGNLPPYITVYFWRRTA